VQSHQTVSGVWYDRDVQPVHLLTGTRGLGWVDVTRTLAPGMAVYPGDPAVKLTAVRSTDRGDACSVGRLILGTHAGTHVDATRHLFAAGPSVDRLALAALVGPARVLDCAGRPVTRDRVAPPRLRGATRLLLRTDRAPVGLTLPAARTLVRSGARLVGIDAPSIERSGHDLPVHRCLLAAGIVILEGLDLTGVAPGPYDLVCLPLKLLGGDGAPARVLLRRRRERRRPRAG
jgi:arylformamidase